MMSFHAPIGLAARAARTARFAIAGLALGAVLSPADAGPQGQQVVAGSVTFTHTGSSWVITASDGSIINYSSFHINPSELVQFVQPSQLAAVLNRINSAEPTMIMGTLLANGQVYFVNPAGVFFMPGSVVDVGGIYAAAGTITNADFLNGVNRFTNLNGSVINQGTINADTTAAMIGKHVGNWGQINAPDGVIAMIAGNNVLLSEIDGHLMVQVDGQGITDQAVPHGGSTAPSLGVRPGVINAGEINADHGQIVLGAGDMYALAIFNSGSIHASGGDVTVAATDGAIHNTGSIDVSVDSGHAGTITVQGPSVVNEGLIAADSDSGQAGDIEVTSQHHTYLLDGSVISAAGGSGTADGGDIFVHSYHGLTVFADGAHIDASGGATGGRGGYAEISGSQVVFDGTVDLSTADGTQLGTLALDPDGIIIADLGTSDAILTAGGGTISFIDASGLTITISDEALESIVGHIVLQSLGDILIQQQVDLMGGPHDVTLHAHGDIIFDAAINGARRLEAIADFDHDGVGDLRINVVINQVLGDALFGGHEIHLSGSVVSVFGTLVFNDAVILEQDTQLAASSISFQSTVDSDSDKAYDLTVQGGTSFHGDVGEAEGGALGDLVVLGSATIDTTHITTLGTQEYDETVTIASDTAILTAQLVQFFDTLEGASAGAQSLEIHGDAIFNEIVGEIPERLLDSLLVSGDAQINGGAINTVHDQTYEGAVTLGQDTILTSTDGGDIHFQSTVDSGFSEGGTSEGGPGFFGPFDLTVATSGLTIFDGVVGGFHQLDRLETINGGETRIGADMFANGIRFFDAVRMTGNADLNGFNFVSFLETIDGDGHDLTVNSPQTLFDGVVSDMGTLHTDADGTTFIAADISGDTILFDDAIMLLAPGIVSAGGVASGIPLPPPPQTITITGDSIVEFASTIDGFHHLIVNSGGDAIFGGAVGNDDALASLTVDSAGDTQINGGSVFTRFDQIYMGAVTLGADTHLASFEGGAIHFFSTVDSGFSEGGTSEGGPEFFGPFDLSVETAGLTTFGGDVGSFHQLDALQTILDGETQIGGDMFANQIQLFDSVRMLTDAELTGFESVEFFNTIDGDGHDLTVDSPFTLFNGVVSDMGDLHTDADGVTHIAADISGDAINFDDAVVLVDHSFIDDGSIASGTPEPTTIVITGDSTVEFASTIDGLHHLVVDSGGPAIFGGAVGGEVALASLSVDSDDDTQINGGVVITEFGQTYFGAVTLGDDTSLRSIQGGDIHFFSTVDSGFVDECQYDGQVAGSGGGGWGGWGSFGPFDLSVETAGLTTFGGDVGSFHKLDALQTIFGGETQIGGDMFANSIDFFDAAVLTNDVELNGFDSVRFFNTLAGDEHDLFVNSPHTLFGGIVSDMATLQTDSDGLTFIAADISGDSITFEDAVILVGPDFLDDGGVASDTPPPPGPQTITITGDSIVEFASTIDGFHHLVVDSGGPAIFGGAVGLEDRLASLTVFSDGDTQINGQFVLTRFGQTYHGAVTLGDDTLMDSSQEGDIHFFSTVDSGCTFVDDAYEGGAAGESSQFCGPFNLEVDTSGLTSFDGVVGGNHQLNFLGSFAGGETQIGADMFANDIVLGDAVTMTGDAILTGFGSVDFFNTIDGDGHDLTINSPETIFRGDVSDMGTLHTDADGITFIGADISGDVLDFDDPIRLFNPDSESDGGVAGAGSFGPQTIVITGDSGVDFAQTIDGFQHLIVNSGSDAHFGGDVGSDEALASFEFNVEGTTTIGGTLIQAAGDISFNPDGHEDIPNIATIAAPDGSLQVITFTGDFLMGHNEKLSVLGDLLISALVGSATLGDLSTLNDMIVLAQQIFVQARPAGSVLNFHGANENDAGTDFVAGGHIIFSVAPTLNGSGTVFFSTPDGFGISDTLAGFLHFAFGPVTAEIFNFDGSVLDLAVRDTGAVNPPGGGGGGGGGGIIDTSSPAGAFTNDVPLDENGGGGGMINDSTALDATRREALRRMNLFVRDANAAELRASLDRRQLYLNPPTKLNPAAQDYQITVNRLRRASVIDAADRFSAMFLDQTTDPATGQAVLNDKSPQIQQKIGAAWDAYAAAGGADTNAAGFRTYLASHPDHVAARQYLNDLNGIFRQVAVMGVTPAELRNSLDGVLGSVKPAGMTQAQLEATIAAGVI